MAELIDCGFGQIRELENNPGSIDREKYLTEPIGEPLL